MPTSAPQTASSESSTVQLQVLVFSVLREQLGTDALTVTLDAPATGRDLIDHLAAAHPPVEAYRAVIRLAVNETYVPVGARLHDGDEVALITPVSGG
jgi:molybdopterin converting factor subunit 1